MSFLLDTDICSAHLKGDRTVFGKFIQYSGRLSISVVTLAELYSWVLRSKAPPARLELLHRFLMGVQLVPVDQAVAYQFGLARARLLDRGDAPASVDMLIAATAMVHDLTLVTHNVSHFLRVPNLSIQDWLE
ncbi:MAG: type II toxin-antitoxin system VapC family toxin [Patescibacteria group bacterium]|nr:type II toxin-antitoxin system VapC family toxin [Patescibacteria group bacterium]